MVFSARSVDVMAQFGMDQAQLTAVSGIGVLVRFRCFAHTRCKRGYLSSC